MPSCPDSTILQAFAVGKLAAGRFDSVAAHVEQCGDCLAHLDALDGVADPLVAQLHDLSEPSNEPIPPSEWASACIP